MKVTMGALILVGIILLPFSFARAQGVAQARDARIAEELDNRADAQLNTQEPQEQDKMVTFGFESYGRYMPDADVDNIAGEIGVADQFSKTSCEVKAFGKLPIEFSLRERYIGIHSSAAMDLPAHLTGLTAGIQTTVPFFTVDNMYLRFDVRPSYFTDDWSFNSSSFRIPNYTALIYKPNEQWTFIAGVAVTPDFDTEVWPLFGVIYKPNDKLIVSLTPDRPNVTYQVNDRLAVFAEGGFTYIEFEVDKKTQDNVPMLYRELHGGVGFRFNINKYIQASASAGTVFYRTMRYQDHSGKANIDPAPYAELKLEIKG